MFKGFRTPHGNAYSHFVKMLGFFVFATAVVLLGVEGVSLTTSFVGGLLLTLSIALSALLGGIFSTLAIRSIFNLVQTGRVIQYIAFALVSTLALSIFEFIFPSNLSIASPLIAGSLLFVLAFLPATLTGTVPYKKRSWLPIARKTRA